MTGRLLTATALVMAAMAATSCTEDVDLPMPVIKLDTESILAPSLLSSFNVAVESNCDWEATADNSASEWLTIEDGRSVGNGEMHLTLRPNSGSSQRQGVITVVNEFNTAMAQLAVTQNPSSGDGLVSVAELRSLSGATNVTLDPEAKVRGVVVSNLQYGNYPQNLIAIEGSAEAGNGIAIKTNDEYLVSFGDEMEIKLQGATLDNDADTGVLVLKPASDDNVIRTEATTIIPNPVDVSIQDMQSGKYESMYVRVPGQLSSEDINKEYLYEVQSLMDEDSNTLPVCVLQTCTFAESMIPNGSGYVCGVAGGNGESNCIYPSAFSDFSMTGTRFGGGFSLPYVISLMMNSTTNFDGRYIAIDREAGVYNYNDFTTTTLDGSGVELTWDLSESGYYFRHWYDVSGHHNFQLGSFMDGQDNYMQVYYPEGIGFNEGFRLQFGWGGMKNAPLNWEVIYSTDNENWSTGKTSTQFALRKGVVAGSGKGFLDYTVDVYIDRPISKSEPLYLKFRRANSTESVGSSITASDSRAAFHSCLILDKLPQKTVSTVPAGAIYFEPFDNLTEGADYRLGEKLCGLLNYGGSELADWTPEQSRGMTGTNVRQRPGYAQIGYVNTYDNAHTAYKNELGQLTTPKLGQAGTFRLSFKAMAYKNKSLIETKAKDAKGDMTQGVIEILGGGTINGQTRVSFGAMDYDSFKSFTYTIEGATADTQIRFTSNPGSDEFSRWFIDNICVK